jgi:hypothetical protein
VSATVSDHNPITCTSCEYRYPRSEGICVICGTPAPAIEPLQPRSAMLDEFSPADEEALFGSDQRKPSRSGPRGLIPIVVTSIALTVFASFLPVYRVYKEFGPATELTSTVGQPKLEHTGPQHLVHYSVKEVPHTVAAGLVTAQTTDSVKELADLWNAVKRGSVHAELALANLYLKGEAVPQNCDQALMLLLAASMKDGKLAHNALKSSYAERCK